MKNKTIIPYFFDKSKSGFCKENFDIVSPEKFRLNNN